MPRLIPAVYMETNRPNGTLYVGVTSNLMARHDQHAMHRGSHFTQRYKLDQLVWYELLPTMADAIEREKQLKAWRRAWKVALIEKMNPEWKNLAANLQDLPGLF